jgi:signal peptidase II
MNDAHRPTSGSRLATETIPGPAAKPSVVAPVIATAMMLAVVIADQASKNLAVGALVDGPAEGPGPFWFRLVANRGALMGFPLPGWFLIGAVVAVVAIAARSLLEPGSRLAALGWGLVVGGALGNLADRFLHRPRFPDHAVVDWIASSVLPTFNLADIAIVAGLVTLAASRRRSKHIEGVAS